MRSVSFACALAAPLVPARAEAPVQTLETFVVSASRSPQDPQFTPSSISLLPLADLEASQVVDLRTALAETPGVTVVNSGATGGSSSVFMRGANSYQTLFIVDGVRMMGDRLAPYQSFLGGADLAGIDRIEILRGPQSTLYGSSAMGGLILIDTAHGCGAPTGSVSATAGSFDTYGASTTVQGGTKQIGYSASLDHLQTRNDRPANDDRQWSYSTRLEGLVMPSLLLGATLRGQQGTYEETGPLFAPSPGTADASNHLVTAYARWNAGTDFSSRLTAALHRSDYTWAGAWPTMERNTRKIIDWQNTWTIAPQAELVAGANLERSRFTVNGVPADDDSAAGFLSATLRPCANLTFTAGLRYDDFKSTGGATTGRTGVAWLPVAGTKLRATYGTGFDAPGYSDRLGEPPYLLPNPALRPEHSRGWDAGIDQDLFAKRVTLSATYFQNRFRDMFDFNSSWTQMINIDRATTEGVEFGLQAHPAKPVALSASYTYLEAHDAISGARLTRRPRQTGDADVRVQPTSAWTVGAGVHVVANRVDYDSSYAIAPIEDYTTVRVYLSCQVTRDLIAKVRIENALGERYAETAGYPALPRAVYGSVEYRF